MNLANSQLDITVRYLEDEKVAFFNAVLFYSELYYSKSKELYASIENKLEKIKPVEQQPSLPRLETEGASSLPYLEDELREWD